MTDYLNDKLFETDEDKIFKNRSYKCCVRIEYPISVLARPICFPADIFHRWFKLDFGP